MKFFAGSAIALLASTLKLDPRSGGQAKANQQTSRSQGEAKSEILTQANRAAMDSFEDATPAANRQKVWTNPVRDKNIAILNAMYASPADLREDLFAKFKPVAKNLCSQGVSFSLFYMGGSVLKRLGVESAQFSQVGTFALGNLLTEQKETLENLFLDKLFGVEASNTHEDRGASRGALLGLHKRLIANDPKAGAIYSADIQTAIISMDRNFVTDTYADPSVMRAKLNAREGFLKAIPNRIFDVSHQSATGDSVVRARIDASVRELIQRYPTDMQPSLRTFIARIRANCFKNDAQFAGAYLFGKPGTGKTYFARNLAEALGLPMFEFNMQGASEESLLGTGHYQASQAASDGIASEEKAIGLLATSVIKSGILNPIVFLDEGGDSLRYGGSVSLLKKMLDPENQKRPIQALGGATVDLSRVTFMISGNDALGDPALKRRIKEIEFSSLPIEAKKKVILQEIDLRIENHRNLSPDIFQQFAKYVKNSFDEIVRQDFEMKSPGVGVAQQVIEDVVNYVTDVLLSAEAINIEELNRVIEDGFRQRLPKP